ncbi:MAG: LytTR family transcriptional regulator DNA-binding domain-containing protein [Ectothiorhodospiraceae bacterium]|nr:LytTR family transcriptional regulator DNA-binding domain-containing protein [Ectothiorhodospiraceae bacterium]
MASHNPFTIRERLTRAARRLAPPLVLGLVLAAIGPFGTFDALPLRVRLPYWLAVVAVNWLLCDLAVRRLDARLPEGLPLRDLSTPLLGGLLAAVPATGVVHTAGVLAGLEVGSLPSLFWKVLLLCAVLSVVFYLNAPESADAAEPPEPDGINPEDPRPAPHTAPPEHSPGALFFHRLETPLQGRLLCLEMQDHYMIVHTTGGRQMVLCRMADAARELEGLGRRVHRSWWVADDAVVGRLRQQGRLMLRLTDGRRVPVGRTYQSAIAHLPPAGGDA